VSWKKVRTVCNQAVFASRLRKISIPHKWLAIAVIYIKIDIQLSEGLNFIPFKFTIFIKA